MDWPEYIIIQLLQAILLAKIEIRPPNITYPATTSAAKMDFSGYSDEELDIFATVPGYADDVKAEKERRGLI